MARPPESGGHPGRALGPLGCGFQVEREARCLPWWGQHRRPHAGLRQVDGERQSTAVLGFGRQTTCHTQIEEFQEML